MTILTLCDVPETKQFSGDTAGHVSLQQHLDELYRSTHVITPNSVRTFLINPRTQLTQESKRYTTTAFSALCRFLAPGLARLVQHVAAVKDDQDESSQFFNIDAACSIFNAVADLRYDKILADKQVVMNEQTSRLEGCLGAKTGYVELSSFIGLVEDSLSDIIDLKFHGASLVGRRLFARYFTPETMHINDAIYHYGYAFCMNDASERDAMRCYMAWHNVVDGTECLIPVTTMRGKGHIRRTGNQFIERLKLNLQILRMDESYERALKLQRLTQFKLFDQAISTTTEGAISYWMKHMFNVGIPKTLSNIMFHRMFGLLSDMAYPATADEIAEKTYYDLFAEILFEAKRRTQALRERLEVAAYLLFSEALEW